MAVEFCNVSVERGGQQILNSVDLTVAPGEVLGIQGPSGAGKSTLLSLLAGLTTPTEGKVSVGGSRIDTLSDRQRSAIRLRKVGVVFQRGDLISELTVGENVALPLRLLGEKRKNAHERASAQLRELGIADLFDRGLDAVSGGQLQRAALARALVHRPSVLLADEPTGALDTATAATAISLVLRLAREHCIASVVVTHDANVARSCDRVAVLSGGQLRMVSASA